ncbi:MAG: signal peptidase [Moorella sp. (in: firmicutes)]|nr:signal peptidase [Moorella sp. (in: firmicutes)]MDK2895153.1 signal peptidase [Moorella sp. (in: firmicutes)]GEA15047.1 lipoprotein signal peptidase [Moorella sp. E308F]GEA17054.1 lipoprotein signal peptidase [Moorella sp. E306M]
MSVPFLLLVALVLGIDQLSKYIIRVNFQPNESLPVINSVFHLTYVNNPGAAFGLLAYKTPVFVTVTLLVAVVILVAYRFLPPDRILLRLALALMLGGALGNLIDRLRFGYVVDFLDFRIWPVFNLADMAIVGGVILLCWELLGPAGEQGKSL